jgi:hypothetical protein
MILSRPISTAELDIEAVTEAAVILNRKNRIRSPIQTNIESCNGIDIPWSFRLPLPSAWLAASSVIMTRSAACDNPPTREQLEIHIRLRFSDLRPRDLNDVIIANTLACFVLSFAFGLCFARPTTRRCDILEKTSSVERSISCVSCKGLVPTSASVTAQANL